MCSSDENVTSVIFYQAFQQNLQFKFKTAKFVLKIHFQ